MYSEENCMTYAEDGAGFCDAVMFKFRKKRHFIMITLLLISAIVSIIAGMYNGLTLKKYSDMAILVGIFFPSIILVFICVYLAFICGRESFRRSPMPRIRHLSGHSRNGQDISQRPQANSATGSERRVSYQSETVTKSLNDIVATGVIKPPRNKIGYTADEPVDYCDAKIYRKHLRSFSNSDISKQMHRRHDVFYKKAKTCKVGYATPNDNQYSLRFRKHKDLNQHKGFKRSISDTTNKKRYAASREDEFVWNTQSLDKLRNQVVRANSLKDYATGQTECESFYEAMRKPSHVWKSYKNPEEYDKLSRFKEYGGYDKRYKIRQDEYANVVSQEDIGKKTCHTKSEICLYSSSVLKPSYKYKQALHFSTFQHGGNDIEDIGEIASCSSSRGEKNNSFSKSDILEMEEKGHGNFPSAQDTYRLRRKTMYFPSANHKESAQLSKEYAHEYCKLSKRENKIVQKSHSRNERF